MDARSKARLISHCTYDPMTRLTGTYGRHGRKMRRLSNALVILIVSGFMSIVLPIVLVGVWLTLLTLAKILTPRNL